jgi:hypothetical protein
MFPRHPNLEPPASLVVKQSPTAVASTIKDVLIHYSYLDKFIFLSKFPSQLSLPPTALRRRLLANKTTTPQFLTALYGCSLASLASRNSAAQIGRFCGLPRERKFRGAHRHRRAHSSERQRKLCEENFR